MVDAVASFEATRGTIPHPARGEEPLRPHRRDRRVRDDRCRPRGGAEPLGPVSSLAATSRQRAPPSSPGWRAHGRSSSRSRPWWRPRRWACPVAPWWAGTRTASRWCSLCWRPMRASGWARTTSLSQRRAGGLRVVEPPPILQSPPLWSPRSRARCYRRDGLFRRDRPVRCHPPGSSGGGNAEGGPEASSASPRPSSRRAGAKARSVLSVETLRHIATSWPASAPGPPARRAGAGAGAGAGGRVLRGFAVRARVAGR